MKLEELQVYDLAMRLSDQTWQIVERWNFFEKDTVGKQWIRAVDSIAANLSEGFGRYHYKENRQFCFYARGSLFESRTWLTKARNRNLVDDENFKDMTGQIDSLGIKLNNYIKSIGPRSSAARAREHQPAYGEPDTFNDQQ